MHIVYLIEQIDTAGGVQRSLITRVNYLIEKFNYKITIVCTLKNSGIPFFQLNEKVDIIFLKHLTEEKTLLGRILLRFNQSRTILKELKPDFIISVKYSLHNLFFYLLPTKTKFISELRESYNDIHSKQNHSFRSTSNLKIREFILRRQDAVIVLTQRDKELWGFKNMYVVPNPQTLQSEQVSDLTNKKVLAIGRLTKVKGFDKLIDVWKIVHASHKDWKLKICGEGEEFNTLKTKIKDLDLGSSIELSNKNVSVIEEFLSSSIFVLTSQFESFGNVLVEAKVFGVPVVSFDAPNGPIEIVKDNEDGFIVEKNDINALAEKIIYLIENEVVRKEFGKNAKENACKYELKSIMNTYNQILQNHK